MMKKIAFYAFCFALFAFGTLLFAVGAEEVVHNRVNAEVVACLMMCVLVTSTAAYLAFNVAPATNWSKTKKA
jgi:hypothetical protein